MGGETEPDSPYPAVAEEEEVAAAGRELGAWCRPAARFSESDRELSACDGGWADTADSDDSDDTSTGDEQEGAGDGPERAGLPTIHFSCRSSARDGVETEFEVTDSSSLCSVSGGPPPRPPQASLSAP